MHAIMMNERAAYLTKILPDGRVLDVYMLTYGRARLTISTNVTAPIYVNAW